MRTVDGIIQDILFENDRGTFTVASFAVDGDDDNVVRAVGSLPGVRPGEEVTLHGSNERELVARVLEMGFSQYSVGRASLEDIYFALTGGMDEFDEHTN